MALSEKYLIDGDALLAAGDLTQASEKYWGAIATGLKAIAAQRQWQHRSHVELRQVARRLADETGDGDFFEAFRTGEKLHANFYEGFLRDDSLRSASVTVHRFALKITSTPQGSVS